MKRMAKTTYEYHENGFLTVDFARGAFEELLSSSSSPVISSVVLIFVAFMTTDYLL